MEAAQAAAKVAGEAEKIVLDKSQLDTILQQMINWCVEAGKNILVAAIVFIIGRFIVSFLNRLLAGMLERRHVETTIQTFLKSLVNILLMVLLVISVVSALGINTTSFAALLASAGVAIGMALSGNLQKAQEMQNEACRIIYKMCSTHGNMYAVIKEILRRNGGPDCGSVRAPLAELVEADLPIVDECVAMINAAIAKYC